MYKLDYVTMAGATVATDTETFGTKEAAKKVKPSILKDIFFRGRS